MAKGDGNNAESYKRKRMLILIEGTLGQGGAAVDKTETESIGETELTETAIMRYRQADGCGHVIHTAAEVGGISICGKVLCAKCAENLCRRCGRPVCGEHVRRVQRDETEYVYCWRCWPWALLEAPHGIVRWVLGGLLLLLLLKLVGGC